MQAQNTYQNKITSKIIMFAKCLEFKKPSFFVMACRKQWHYISEFLRPKFGLLQRYLLLVWTLLWVHVWWINQKGIGSYQMLWLLLLIFHSTWNLKLSKTRWWVWNYGWNWFRALHLAKKLWQEVIKVIKNFFLFLKTFNPHNVHNRLAIMLDLHFKFLQIVENYVSHGVAICLASEYDAKQWFHYLWLVLIDWILLPEHVQLLLMCPILNLKKKKVICLVLEHPWKNCLVLL